MGGGKIMIVLAMWVATCGCRAHQLRKDQDQFRHALLHMQTEQLMDNLVRAYNGLPIVHVDYTQITGSITHNAQGDLSGSYTDPSGPITRVFNYMLGGSQQNQLAVTGNPVIDANVYMSYLEFLEKTDRLVVSLEPPPPGAAHVCREFCGKIYWVPAEYRMDFLNLSLKTSGMRGQPLVAPEFLPVKVLAAKRHDPAGEGNPVVLDVTLASPITPDRGTVRVKIDGIVYSLAMLVAEGSESKEETDHIWLRYSYGEDRERRQIPIEPDILAQKLADKELEIFFATVRLAVPTVETLLGSINHQLGLIRLDEMRRGR